MILWLNGTFGVGKTTTADEICARGRWRLFDPEHVGFMVAANLRDREFDDFQQLPPWRALVPAVAEELHRYTDTPLVAVQTVLVEEYWTELAASFERRRLPVFHVLLDCGTDELRRRIETDEVESQARQWRLDHLAVFEEARHWLAPSVDLIVDTTELAPQAAAETIIDAADGRR